MRLVTLSIQMTIKFLWMMSKDPMRIQVQMLFVEKTLPHLGLTMQRIIEECEQGGVIFYHATSHMKIVTSNIWNIHLTKSNESLNKKNWCSKMWKMVLGIQLNDWNINMKWCLNIEMYKIKDIMNRCPIHLIIKIILVD